MRHMPLRECGYAIAFVVLLLFVYGGAYFAMMERKEIGHSPHVSYRFGEEWTEAIFAPAHDVDRRVRPDVWQNELDPAAVRNLRTLEREYEQYKASIKGLKSP